MTTDATPRPLAGVQVVEFTNLIAGPYAGMLLADLGAEVTKVEPPSGDLGRSFGPYVDGESAFFLAANRGKRTVVVDMRAEEGRERAMELASSADVVIHNLRAGAMERAGLSEAAIRERNPRVVYAVISAFAADGPDATRAGIDVVFQAESGMISISGEEGGPVSKTATTVGDYLAGTNTALAVCAALVERASTGIGRRVDVSLRDGLMAIQGGWNAIAFATGEQPLRRGTASPYLGPNQVFDASDGQIAIAVVSERHWRLLCDALGRPDLVDRFPTNDERMARLDDLVVELQAVLQKERADHWVRVLNEAGLPVGHVRTLLGAFEAAPHMRLDLGTMPVTGSPVQIDRHRLGNTSRAPSLGE